MGCHLLLQQAGLRNSESKSTDLHLSLELALGQRQQPTLPGNNHDPKTQNQNAVYTRFYANTASQWGQKTHGWFPNGSDAWPKLRQLEKPRIGGNTKHRDRANGRVTAWGVQWGFEQLTGKRSRSFPWGQPSKGGGTDPVWNSENCTCDSHIALVTKHIPIPQAKKKRIRGWYKENWKQFCPSFDKILIYKQEKYYVCQYTCDKWEIIDLVFSRAPQISFSPWEQFQLGGLGLTDHLLSF